MKCIILPPLLPQNLSIDKLNRSSVRINKFISIVLANTTESNFKVIYKEALFYIFKAKYRSIFMQKYLNHLILNFPSLNTYFITHSEESFKNNVFGSKNGRPLSGIYTYKVSKIYSGVSRIYGNAKGNPKPISNLPRE
ncbi:MAG: hypothetical protein IPN79_14855 [Saprospiraceae bacterium]|nr:hypothetical protein [Saprospiraceae bacterium]